MPRSGHAFLGIGEDVLHALRAVRNGGLEHDQAAGKASAHRHRGGMEPAMRAYVSDSGSEVRE